MSNAARHAIPGGSDGGKIHVYNQASDQWDLGVPLLQLLADAKGDVFVATGPDTVVRVGVGANGQVLTADSALAAGVKWAAASPSGGTPAELGIPISDETTVITAGTNKMTFRMPHAMTLTGVRINVNTASSSGVVTVDVNENGSTVLSTKATIDATEKTSVTAAVPPVISDSTLADDAEITVDIDTAGTGVKGLKLWLLGTRV